MTTVENKVDMKERNRQRALMRYYQKRYGDRAEEMLEANKLKKANAKVAEARGVGRPATQTKEEYREKQRKCCLKRYYTKRYGDKAETLMNLNKLKKTLV